MTRRRVGGAGRTPAAKSTPGGAPEPARRPAGRLGPDPPPADPSTDRAAIALWLALAVLAAARAAFAFLPGTWLWPQILHRFLSPVTGWGLWLLVVLALLPGAARVATPLSARWGDALTRHPVLAATGWAVAAWVLAWLLPD